MMQVPALLKAAVEPLRVQTLILSEVKVTGLPERPPVALTA